MSVQKDVLPVYAAGHKFIGNVTIDRAKQLIKDGSCVEYGTKTRVRGLLSKRHDIDLTLDAASPQIGRYKYTTKWATLDGVPVVQYAFKRLYDLDGKPAA